MNAIIWTSSIVLIGSVLIARYVKKNQMTLIVVALAAFLVFAAASGIKIVGERSACSNRGGDPTTVKTWSGMYKTICQYPR